ncbi:hypothetical protein WJX84_008997 [Apatococcus fuscideae]|uniref:N-acetyltransferase domain-containing protein n=1 Tax=Apatococcus fuscideae TaxID=2026836 RepID=A0AAW1SR90_9CHLO
MTDRLLARSSASLCHTAVVLRTRTRIKALPRLSYNHKLEELDLQEAADLVTACRSRASDEAALRCHTGLGYFHQACSGAEENEERIKRALQHSWAIVYAHAREDQLHASSQQSTTSADSPEKDGQDSWEWVRERRRARSRRRKLVGLARLSSDHTLVAVLSDVVVLPELRSQGIGRTLLRRLVNVSVSRGITDIGVMAPPDCQGFFTKCGPGEVWYARSKHKAAIQAL